jgi:GntR family transcriptional regulator/MocR family aminotransferase
VRAVPVDASGLRVDLLERHDKAVYVTPAHQFPLGARMPVDRRTQLLDWAVENETLVFEDDYDGEFRYDVAPMPALRSMRAGDECVVYIGTASKVIARDLRLAWAIVPTGFREVVRSRLFDDGDLVNPVAAGALASLLESGALVRQVVSLQRTYAARRARFTEACDKQLPEMRRHGVHAGLHVVLTREEPFDDRAAVEQLMRRGLVCTALSSYYLDQSGEPTTGLVCGYARLPETRAVAAVALIREVLGP